MAIQTGDTICAVATPPGHGGIGVVRVSGPAALGIMGEVWSGGVERPEPRHAYLCDIIDIYGNTIDRAIAIFMKAPHSYTGEDVVEFHTHGSPVILKKIVEACIAAGARAAGPGEFTRRAFMAGKLDLTQAEAVAGIINAESEGAAKVAAEHLAGRLSKEVTDIGGRLAAVRTFVEASIDFPEEEIPERDKEKLRGDIDSISNPLARLAETFFEGRILTEGVRVAIVGRPNAGKSSVFNQLVGSARAIVHHEPGTTRDVVEEVVAIGGIVFKLKDTAGFREAGSEVEAIGIEKTKSEIACADVVIAVFDSSREFSDEDRQILRLIDAGKTTLILNKSDIAGKFCAANSGCEKIFEGAVSISAKSGEGMDKLKTRLLEMISTGAGRHEGTVITSARHKELLDCALTSIAEAKKSLEKKEPLECTASHLKSAQDALGKITGQITSEEILDRIFSQFCVGK